MMLPLPDASNSALRRSVILMSALSRGTMSIDFAVATVAFVLTADPENGYFQAEKIALNMGSEVMKNCLRTNIQEREYCKY